MSDKATYGPGIKDINVKFNNEVALPSCSATPLLESNREFATICPRQMTFMSLGDACIELL